MTLTCLRDARARRLETEVLACEPEGDAFRVVLGDTVLYPEGGGQPADRGWIDGVAVHDVQREGGAVVHRAARALPLGPAMVEVDWSRRWDHMQQHSAQHLLTAVAQEVFGWATTSFHLHPSVSDIELDVPPDPDRLDALEEAVNARIRQALPVVVREVAAEDLPGLAVRSRGLPEGLTGPVRLVIIEGVDANTCGGTHVASTAELGVVKLLGVERLTRGSRLHWLAGDRVRRSLGEALALQAALGRRLSAGPEAQLEAVDRLIAEAKAAAKRADGLQAELAGHLGAALARGPGSVLALHRPEASLPFLQAVAKAARADAPDALVLCTGGEEEGVFILSGPRDRVDAARSPVLEALGARGGGAPGHLQGRATRLSGTEALLARLRGADDDS